MDKRRFHTPEQALQKARHYCAYQERSHDEVRRKLQAFGLKRTQVEEALSSLIEEDYLNEERFAVAFAGGKFRVRKWGRNRIEFELRQRGVAEANITRGLGAIDEREYADCIAQLVAKKRDDLKRQGLNDRESSARIVSHLYGRGFESTLVRSALADLMGTGG